MLSRILNRLQQQPHYIIQDTTPTDDLYPIVLASGDYITHSFDSEMHWHNVTPIINHDQSVTMLSNGNLIGYMQEVTTLAKQGAQ